MSKYYEVLARMSGNNIMEVLSIVGDGSSDFIYTGNDVQVFQVEDDSREELYEMYYRGPMTGRKTDFGYEYFDKDGDYAGFYSIINNLFIKE